MGSLLQYLENNEAILLMYLADELPPEDRAEVEQMLATDAGLRAELARLRLTQDSVDSSLAALDRDQRLALSQPLAVRQISRLMNQWWTRKMVAPAAVPVKKGLKYPWWSYPLATAAAVLIAFLVWWGNQPSSNGPDSSGQNHSSQIAVDEGASTTVDLSMDDDKHNDELATAEANFRSSLNATHRDDVGSVFLDGGQ